MDIYKTCCKSILAKLSYWRKPINTISSTMKNWHMMNIQGVFSDFKNVIAACELKIILLRVQVRNTYYVIPIFSVIICSSLILHV